MNIILVDDEDVSRRAIAGFLKDPLKHNVVEFNNCDDAFKFYTENRYELVISDIRMPGMNGIDLLRAIKNIDSKNQTKVILITGYGELETSLEALRIGAYDYLLKPLNVNELANILDKIKKELTATPQTDSKGNTNLERRLEQYNSIFSKLFPDKRIGVFSAKMQEVVQLALAYHNHRDLPVLINGETGTGKEIIARMIHQGEDENNRPFISVNCSAINNTLFESELFGYEKGAFTGAATSGSIGKLELAQGGTILFDEIGDLPLDLQPKLLRVLQEKEFYRVQGKRPIKLDVRFIFATNVDLMKSIAKGEFRQDLYYRITSGNILIPPLRERVTEIGMLALLFLKEASSARGKSFRNITSQALEILENNPWYGNVRELKSVIDRIVLLFDDVELNSSHLESLSSSKTSNTQKSDSNFTITLPANFLPIDELEYEIATTILKKFDGNISRSARYLDVSFRRFKRMAKMN